MTIGENCKVSSIVFAQGVLEFARQCLLMSDEKIVYKTAENTFRKYARENIIKCKMLGVHSTKCHKCLNIR